MFESFDWASFLLGMGAGAALLFLVVAAWRRIPERGTPEQRQRRNRMRQVEEIMRDLFGTDRTQELQYIGHAIRDKVASEGDKARVKVAYERILALLLECSGSGPALLRKEAHYALTTECVLRALDSSNRVHRETTLAIKEVLWELGRKPYVLDQYFDAQEVAD